MVIGKKFVEIKSIEMVGKYAIRIIFSDGHDSGIYSFSYLHQLGQNKYSIQKRYLQALKKYNKSRIPYSMLKKMKQKKEEESKQQQDTREVNN